MIWRMSQEIVDLGDVCVEFFPERNDWFSLNGQPLSYIQMQNLSLFLEQEEEDRQERFNLYLEKVINNLIYNI